MNNQAVEKAKEKALIDVMQTSTTYSVEMAGVDYTVVHTQDENTASDRWEIYRVDDKDSTEQERDHIIEKVTRFIGAYK